MRKHESGENISKATAAEAAELAAAQLTDDDRRRLDELRQSMESGEVRQQLDQMRAELEQLDQIDAAGGADQ